MSICVDVARWSVRTSGGGWWSVRTSGGEYMCLVLLGCCVRTSGGAVPFVYMCVCLFIASTNLMQGVTRQVECPRTARALPNAPRVSTQYQLLEVRRTVPPNCQDTV